MKEKNPFNKITNKVKQLKKNPKPKPGTIKCPHCGESLQDFIIENNLVILTKDMLTEYINALFNHHTKGENTETILEKPPMISYLKHCQTKTIFQVLYGGNDDD